MCAAQPLRLSPVPQHLDQRDRQRMRRLVLVRRIEDHPVGLPVRAAREQDREVHSRYAQCGPPVIGRDGGKGAAQDAALRVAVVVERRGAERRSPGDLERRVGRQALGVAHQPAEVQEVQEPLLDAVGHLREFGQVAEDADRVRQVRGRETRPVGRAERDVVLVCHQVHVGAPGGLSGVAQQPVAVERGPALGADGRTRHHTGERRRRETAGALHGEPTGAVVETTGRGAARRGEIARHLERAGHPAQQVRVLRGREVLDVRHGERGRRSRPPGCRRGCDRRAWRRRRCGW